MAEGPVAGLSEHSGETPVRRIDGAGPARLGEQCWSLAMQVHVETYVDEGGFEKLRRFHLDGRTVEVADNIDEWRGAGYRYVKVKGSDGVYILRFDEAQAEWELTMYQRSESQSVPAKVTW